MIIIFDLNIYVYRTAVFTIVTSTKYPTMRICTHVLTHKLLYELL